MEKTHLGSPCIHCAVIAEDVQVGDCPNNNGGLAAATRELSYYNKLLRDEVARHKVQVTGLHASIAKTNERLAQINSGLDVEAIERAEKFMYVHGYTGAGEQNGAVSDAIIWFSGAPRPEGRYYGSLHSEYFGCKNYDRWQNQRSDHAYCYGPRHGYTVFEIGLVQGARGFELTPEQRDDAIYYLKNIEAISKAKIANTGHVNLKGACAP